MRARGWQHRLAGGFLGSLRKLAVRLEWIRVPHPSRTQRKVGITNAFAIGLVIGVIASSRASRPVAAVLLSSAEQSATPPHRLRLQPEFGPYLRARGRARNRLAPWE